MTELSYADDPLSGTERVALLRVARDGLEAAVLGRAPVRLPEEARGRLVEPRACFVTLRIASDLRGCIGALEARLPLAEHVRVMAGAAALRDPRFAPVEAEELSRIALSLSVLTPARRVHGPDDIRVGAHGLVVSHGACRGVLLPQVAVEHGWDAPTFLAQTCGKAGLPRDAWREVETAIEVFSAEVFDEARTLKA